MNHPWRRKKYNLQLWLFGTAMLSLIPIGLSLAHYVTLPSWITLVLVIYISVASTFAIADYVEDIISRRGTGGTILTFVITLYILPLIAVGISEDILDRAGTSLGKLVLYLIGYSINILYCIIHRDIVEVKMSEFKAAMYISAGIYVLLLAIFSILDPAMVESASTTRIAAITVSFTMCRGIVEIFAIPKGRRLPKE